MNKAYHLGTCSTCRQILKETGILDLAASGNIVLQDIKKERITPPQLDELKKQAGSYEALFSRRSQLYKARGLKGQTLKETDYRNYILEDYSFLKRPVVVLGKKIFIGNDKQTVASLKEALQK